MYLTFSNWFGTKRTLSAWFQMNQKMVNTIRFQFDLIRFRKYFSVCAANLMKKKNSVAIQEANASSHNWGPLKALGTIFCKGRRVPQLGPHDTSCSSSLGGNLLLDKNYNRMIGSRFWPNFDRVQFRPALILCQGKGLLFPFISTFL